MCISYVTFAVVLNQPANYFNSNQITPGIYAIVDLPNNDLCQDANEIFCNNTVTGDTTDATENDELLEFCGTDQGSQGVWYTFTGTGDIVTMSLCGSSFDTKIQVYEGIYGSLTCITGNNDSCDSQSEVQFLSTAGSTYYIYVFGSDSNAGIFTFNLSCANIPPPITTNNTQYTITELIEDILIDVNPDCPQVFNITSSTGINFAGESANGIGYFGANGSSFPFEKGIVMTTGDALKAPGPETGTISDGSSAWPGDSDLENAIPGLFPDETFNASIIEFDFVPIIDQMSFDFIFAAEEYGPFQCLFSDSFAFLLTDSNGVTINIAIVPETTDPISVISVRDEAYNMDCPSANAEYFGAYYGIGGLPAFTNPTNFLGRTVSMKAMASVIPNETYHIKLVVADYVDSTYDSAVFSANSFEIGYPDLGNDQSVFNESSDFNSCQGDIITLDAGELPSNATIKWYKNGEPIDGAINQTIDVTETATYIAEYTFSNSSCKLSDDVLIEFFPTPDPSFTETRIIKCANEEQTLQMNVANIDELNSLTYLWTLDPPGDNTPIEEIYIGPNSTYVLNPNAEQHGIINVLVTDDVNGCSREAQMLVEFYQNEYCIDLPQGLSPNEDGVNDCLILDHLEDREDITQIDIFNRLGIKIYELNNFVSEWCGTDQDGNKMPVGTYYYVIYTNAQKPRTSWIYLNY